jgi:hypothetical protein
MIACAALACVIGQNATRSLTNTEQLEEDKVILPEGLSMGGAMRKGISSNSSAEQAWGEYNSDTSYASSKARQAYGDLSAVASRQTLKDSSAAPSQQRNSDTSDTSPETHQAHKKPPDKVLRCNSLQANPSCAPHGQEPWCSTNHNKQDMGGYVIEDMGGYVIADLGLQEGQEG